jgi:hypothetical protein
MGILRIALIVISLSILDYMHGEDGGRAWFAAIFVFYAMLLLDYTKMYNSKDDYEKFIGFAGIATCLVFVTIPTFALFDRVVIIEEQGTYIITNSINFKLLSFEINLITYQKLFSYLTFFVALFELLIFKYAARLGKKEEINKQEKSAKVQVNSPTPVKPVVEYTDTKSIQS